MSTKNLLKGLKRPKQVEFNQTQGDACYAKFSAEPFEKGFGTSIANSLRRTLMSSVPGTAVTAIRIAGVSHEFSSIEGVVEDVVKIILNLKQLQVSYDTDEREEPRVIHIEKKGAGVLCASDLAVDSAIQILNPELVIATLNEDADLVIDIQLEKGRGYVSASILKEYTDDIDTITIDALFSPIKRVSFNVSETRIGQRTDYEKVELEIWTDGSITPEDALAQAAKILKDHLLIFINFEEEAEDLDEESNGIDEELKVKLLLNVESLGLSIRTLSLLKSLEINLISDLVRRNENELKKSRHYSSRCAEEVHHKLNEFDLEFGMYHLFYNRDS